MITTDIDNSDVIDLVRTKIEDAKQAGIALVGNATRQHGEHRFVLGYIEGLLAVGVLSRDTAYRLVAELEQAWKEVLATPPKSLSKPVKKLKI